LLYRDFLTLNRLLPAGLCLIIVRTSYRQKQPSDLFGEIPVRWNTCSVEYLFFFSSTGEIIELLCVPTEQIISAGNGIFSLCVLPGSSRTDTIHRKHHFFRTDLLFISLCIFYPNRSIKNHHRTRRILRKGDRSTTDFEHVNSTRKKRVNYLYSMLFRVRTYPFLRRRHFVLIRSAIYEQIVFTGWILWLNTFFTEEIHWLLPYRVRNVLLLPRTKKPCSKSENKNNVLSNINWQKPVQSQKSNVSAPFYQTLFFLLWTSVLLTRFSIFLLYPFFIWKHS